MSYNFSLMSYNFQCTDVSPPWLNLFLSSLLLFNAIIIEIVCFISFSDNSQLVYGNATDFCMLILTPTTFLNLLIRFNRF